MPTDFDTTWKALSGRTAGELMAELGIDDDDLQLFCNWLAPVGHPYLLKRVVPSLGMEDGGFFPTQLSADLNKGLVAGHLAHHRYTVSTLRAWEDAGTLITNVLIIDLDQHGAGAPLSDRLAACLRAFGEPDLMFRSSATGGLHLYYLLKECEVEHLVARAERLLAAEGVALVSGQVEIFPSGPASYLRMPCGWGSSLLNPDDLSPITDDRNRQLRLVLDRLDAIASDLESPASRWPLPPHVLAAPVPRVSIASSSSASTKDMGTREGFEHYLRVGLPGYGTRNEVLTRYMFTGFCATSESLVEAKRRAVAWMLAQKGRSRTVDQRPGQAAAHVEQGVEDTWAFLQRQFPQGFRWHTRHYPAEDVLVRVVRECRTVSTRADAVKNAIRFCFVLLYRLSTTSQRSSPRLAANYLKKLPGASSNPNRPTHYLKLVSMLERLGLVERGESFRPTTKATARRHTTKFVLGKGGRVLRQKIPALTSPLRGIPKSMNRRFERQAQPPDIQKIFTEAIEESALARYVPLTWLTDVLPRELADEKAKVSTK